MFQKSHDRRLEKPPSLPQNDRTTPIAFVARLDESLDPRAEHDWLHTKAIRCAAWVTAHHDVKSFHESDPRAECHRVHVYEQLTIAFFSARLLRPTSMNFFLSHQGPQTQQMACFPQHVSNKLCCRGFSSRCH